MNTKEKKETIYYVAVVLCLMGLSLANATLIIIGVLLVYYAHSLTTKKIRLRNKTKKK